MSFKEATEEHVKMFLSVTNAIYRYLNTTEVTALRHDIPQHRTILGLRQQIMQCRLRKESGNREASLWDAMERAFKEAATLE